MVASRLKQPRLARISDFLFAASTKIPDIRNRKNARLAAIISLSLIVIFTIFMINAYLGGEPSSPTDMVSYMFLIGIYVFSRTRFHSISLFLIMVLAPANTFTNVFLGTTYNVNSTLQFLVIGYGLATVFLTPPWTAVFSVANLAIILLIPRLAPPLVAESVNMPVHITINVLLGIVVTVANIHRADIEKARQDENRRNSAAALTSLTRALEVRHKETAGHSNRAIDLTIALAKQCGIKSKDRLRQIREGALLHDIGKIAVPDTILLKNGELTPEEWEIIKTHPRIGFELLQEFDFLKDSLAIPRYHHERFDGSGYPDGLAGEQIPLEARIFAVVDVYDALLEERPYRPPWSMPEIIDHFSQNTGILYDPDIVSNFFELMDIPADRLGS